MIGLGTWNFDVNLPFIQVNPTVIISADEKGKYVIDMNLGGVTAEPSYKIIDIKEQKNSLLIKVSVPMVKIYGDVSVNLTFDGDKCQGIANIPMVGRITVNGKKVEDYDVMDWKNGK